MDTVDTPTPGGEGNDAIDPEEGEPEAAPPPDELDPEDDEEDDDDDD